MLLQFHDVLARVRTDVTLTVIRHNSGDGTTPNKVEIRSLRQINLRPLCGVLQGGRLRIMRCIWLSPNVSCVFRTGERFSPLGNPLTSVRAYLTDFGFR
ncbi:hypothetical protein ALC57_12344 [Trachymyrmex cornetzi]|uniref:Uncharacterized protein n=1 Tax=Trachymyrmex cornetzi TaxID=471704 RepID=A0A195DQV5_9HYME|nr:hypothetical protein ALC57_12344 [Trachymyrmex cornetzi]